MTKLDCNVVNCAYNTENCCKRSDICVEGEDAGSPSATCCGSFAPKGCGCATNSTGCVCKDTDVKCEAVECMYNNSRMCHANHIGISGGHADRMRETECASFTKG